MKQQRMIIDTETLQQTVCDLAERINAAYAKTDNITALVILEGAKFFAEDLLRQLSFPVQVEYLKASSYRGAVRSNGTVDIAAPADVQQNIRGRHILVIDDIYDTGRTLATLLDWLSSTQPKSIKTCVLLEKKIVHDKPIRVDFLGRTIDDVFVIGYGLDFNGRYRELPYIAALTP